MKDKSDPLSVSEALAIVLEHARALPSEIMPLMSSSLGRVLAEPIASDIDMPPFTKSLMDGYAVRSADVRAEGTTLQVIEEVNAGQTPTKEVGQGQATRIMTGAPVPAGADAVVPVERTTAKDEHHVRIETPAKPNQFILERGSEMKSEEVVLPAGTVLRPQEFGLLATVGRTAVQLIAAPKVNLLSTGDEVVEAARRPRQGQIRNSNGPLLVAQSCRIGGLVRYLGIAKDTKESLRPLIDEGLDADILVLSGGVSAGKRDLVPEVLEEAGMVAHFHKVHMKPGKPVLFGTRQREGNRGPTLIFGLPGNPVSTLACFELFVRPAIRRMAGHAQPGPHYVSAKLSASYAYRSDRPTYHPAHLGLSGTGLVVEVVPWRGSPDLRALTRANALVVLPEGEHEHAEGQSFKVLPLGAIGED